MHKQVATFIVQKILLDDIGLRYVCATPERFYAVGSVLGNMVISLADQPSTRLLKHIIRCYLRLSDNPRFVLSFIWHQMILHLSSHVLIFVLPHRACVALHNCLPDMLKDGTFNISLRVSHANISVVTNSFMNSNKMKCSCRSEY